MNLIPQIYNVLLTCDAIRLPLKYCYILDDTGEAVEWPVVIKSKPLDSETATMINKMAQACGLELAVQYERHKLDTGFR